MKRCLPILPLLFALAACEPEAPRPKESAQPSPFRIVGRLESPRLDEASGMQAIPGGYFVLHNDEGEQLFLTDYAGSHLGRIKVKKARNRDWEDITRVPGPKGPLLIIGDIGDKQRMRKKLKLYFVPEPSTGDGELRPVHEVTLRLPDRPRDIEAMAYDPSGEQILFLSKADQPPRLYRAPLDAALAESELKLEFLGEVPGFRPPSRRDILTGLNRGLRVSQPTGMDISADGRLAAVITYRSLYLFRRAEGETWLEAFQRPPQEFPGPPGLHEEAVTFSENNRAIYVTSERHPAPVSRLDLPKKPYSPPL